MDSLIGQIRDTDQANSLQARKVVCELEYAKIAQLRTAC